MFKFLNSTLLMGLFLGLTMSSCARSGVSTPSVNFGTERFDEGSERAFYNEAQADLFVYYDRNEFEIYRINKLEPRIRVVDRDGLRVRAEKHLATRNRAVVLVSKASQVGEDFEQEMSNLVVFFKDLEFRKLSIHLASGIPGRSIYKEVNLE